MRALRTLAAGLLVSTALIAGPARAQSDAQTIAALKAQVEALTRRVDELEHARAATPSAPAAPAPKAAAGAAPVPARSPTATALPMQTASRGPSVPVGPIERPLQPVGGAFQLSASGDSSEVALRLGTEITKGNIAPNGRGNAARDTLSLTASAPLNKDDPRTDLGTLDGFANSALLKLRWTRFTVPIAIPRLDPVANKRNEVIKETARAACRAKAKADEDELKKCNDPDIDDSFIADWDPTEASEFLALGFPSGPSFAFGLEGSIGYKNFKYFDAATLAEQSQKKVPLGAKAFVTWYPNSSLMAITGSLEYQRAWEDQDSAVMCPASTTTGPIKCVDGPIGAPDRKNKVLGALEFRKQFMLRDFWIPSIGIAPQITYDFSKKVGGLDFPIYLVPDEKGNLLGGVRFGYRTDTDDLIVGVFVGTAFSFHP